MTEVQRSPGLLYDTEAELIGEAYEIAILALGLTHEIDDIVRTILAECIIRISRAQDIAEASPEHSTSILAARGVNHLLATYNDCISGDGKTLH